MSKMNVILIYRTGGDFSFSDIHLLANHIQAKSDNVSVYCVANSFDTPTKLVNCSFLPMTNTWRGWWAKMNLFSPELERYRPFLFVDLDTAIIGDIRQLQPAEDMLHNFIMLRDFYRLSRPASGVMWVPANSEKVDFIWRTWKTNPEGFMKKYRGDQEFIIDLVKPDAFWQDLFSGIYTFKPTQRNWRNELPEDSKLICFHGKPRIWDAVAHVKWVYDYVYYGRV